MKGNPNLTQTFLKMGFAKNSQILTTFGFRFEL